MCVFCQPVTDRCLPSVKSLCVEVKSLLFIFLRPTSTPMHHRKQPKSSCGRARSEMRVSAGRKRPPNLTFRPTTWRSAVSSKCTWDAIASPSRALRQQFSTGPRGRRGPPCCPAEPAVDECMRLSMDPRQVDRLWSEPAFQTG